MLASILPAGMRAISTKITEESAVGKLILPNDHVDVILTQRKRGRPGRRNIVSDILSATCGCSPSVSGSM